MADTQKVDDISAVTVSSKVMAEIIGVGDRQVRNLANEGILARNSHGRYLLMKSVKNYILNLKIAKAGEKVISDFDESELDLDNERAKHEHLKSMITEIKLQLIRGQVHKSEDVGAVITNMFTKFRSKMMALPYKLAPKLAGRKKDEIAAVLKNEVEFALRELADYKPSDYYPSEYIDSYEDDFLGVTEAEGGSYEE
ncbi:MAG: hypothetical protein K1W06_11370 [Lachnospiraceae bacterium]